MNLLRHPVNPFRRTSSSPLSVGIAKTLLGAALLPCSLTQSAFAAPSLYSQGNPSNDEQYVLELINRARANPMAEGQRLAGARDALILKEMAWFSVSPGTLQSDFASYAAAPPVAMNTQLSAAARRLGLDEAAKGFQGHTGSDGSTSMSRLTDAGYAPLAYGENTYATVENAFFGHAAFNVDWGVSDLVHRELIMGLVPTLPTFREVGISIVPTTAAGYGPLVLTEEFGLQSKTPLAVGVAFIDSNADGFYSPGEGVGGITVSSPQSSYYTVTSPAGGYSLPLDLVSADESAHLIFVDASGTQVARNETLPILPTSGVDAAYGNTLANVKVDLVMTGPSISSATPTVDLISIKNAVRSTPKNGKFVLGRSGGDASQALVIHYSLAGSAISGADYKPVAGIATFPPGVSRLPVKIKPVSATSPLATPLTVTLSIEAGDDYRSGQSVTLPPSLTIK